MLAIHSKRPEPAVVAVSTLDTKGPETADLALSRTLPTLHADGRGGGVVALGGAEGAVMAAQAMQALPLGVPKLIVTPVAAGRRTFGPFVGLRDVMLMHSVGDIRGLNSVSRAIFDNAAGAI